MNVFEAGGSRPEPPAKRVAVVLIVCLVLSLVFITARAVARVRTAKARAANVAKLASAALSAQLRQALVAAEALGSEAGQSPDFLRQHSGVLALNRSMTSLEWQPGGVTRDIVPRPGNEKAIGFDVFKDPARRRFAEIAVKTRTMTLTEGVRLYNGETGFYVFRPVFQRSPRDNRESFVGFVTASISLPQAVAQAQLGELTAQGYSYAIAAADSGRGKGAVLVRDGAVSDGVQQLVWLGNIELQLAIAPRNGWLSLSRLALDCLAALVFSGLAGLVVGFWTLSEDLQTSSSAAARQLEDAKKQLGLEKERARTAQAELKTAQVGLQEMEAKLAPAQALIQEAQLQAKKVADNAEQARHLAEARVKDLETRLQTRHRAVEDAEQHHKKELDQLKAMLEKTGQSAKEQAQLLEGTIADLRVELETARQATADAEQRSLVHVEALKAGVAEAKAQSEQLHRSLTETRMELDRVQQRLTTSPPESAPPETHAPVPSVDGGNAGSAGSEEPAMASVDASVSEPSATEPAQGPAAQVEPGPVDLASLSESKPEPVRETQSAVAAEDRSQRLATAAEARPRRTGPKPSKKANPQMDLFGAPSPGPAAEVKHDGAAQAEATETPEAEREHAKAAVIESPPEKGRENHKSSPARPAPRPPPLNVAELREAAHAMVPLLSDHDPGAMDCLKDNRTTFRSAFSVEAFVEFEECVKAEKFGEALEQLRKAARRAGIAGL